MIDEVQEAFFCGVAIGVGGSFLLLAIPMLIRSVWRDRLEIDRERMREEIERELRAKYERTPPSGTTILGVHQ